MIDFDRSLPVCGALPALQSALAAGSMAILQAPPGAGKSTGVPPALLDEDWLAGRRILMLEPRRLAARAIAARMAAQAGEQVGRAVGYRVRFEQRVGATTRIEVLTEGILTRRLQHDPALDGVGLLIFDEFHERSLHADLALALARQAQQLLRPDLRILVMSATLDTGMLSTALGGAPVVEARGRSFPVDIRYLARDPLGPVADVTADGVSRAVAETNGDVLVFLPGAGEIARCLALVQDRHPDLICLPLYGELPLDRQQAAIEPDSHGRRKIVFATSIAETSLTIVGTRVVVDMGLARVPRFDSRTGLTRLETARVTLDSADQRAGRAGRLGPGVCHRLWSQETQARLIPTRKPEILDADLASLRLELAQWGARDAGDMQWVTSPPPGAMAQALALLRMLGAMSDDVLPRLTDRGRAMLDWPTHPRLAHLLIEAAASRDAATAALAADVAALLDDRDPLPRTDSIGADIGPRIEALRLWRRARSTAYGADPGALGRLERIASAWRTRLNVRADDAAPDPYVVGMLVAWAYPDRVAQNRGGQSHRYRLRNGRGAVLRETDPLAREPWLAVAHLDAGTEEGRIYLAAPLRRDDIAPLCEERDVVRWDGREGALVARREWRLGELVVSSRAMTDISETVRSAVLLDAVRAEGLALLNWTPPARQWQARCQSLHLWRGGDWPDVSDAALLARLDDWLGPWLGAVSRRGDFARLDVLRMLAGLLTRRLASEMEFLAPAHIRVPSGSEVRLEYQLDGSPPVLAVKLQEVFGLADTPTVNDGRVSVLLHLLSPAGRPMQVTQDLRSFWQNTYPAVRRELRGRYNKHPWPEDPWTAVPTRKTVKGARRAG